MSPSIKFDRSTIDAPVSQGDLYERRMEIIRMTEEAAMIPTTPNYWTSQNCSTEITPDAGGENGVDINQGIPGYVQRTSAAESSTQAGERIPVHESSTQQLLRFLWYGDLTPVYPRLVSTTEQRPASRKFLRR
jgi:hypothetical protein